MLKHIIAAIRAHAAEQYPKECCGLLLSIGRKQKYFPCRNIASEPNDEFRLDPEDYAAAEDLGEVIGIVHSHPDATSRPSPHDLAMCEATALPWHILSWPEGDLRTITPIGNTPLLKRPLYTAPGTAGRSALIGTGANGGLSSKPSSVLMAGGRARRTPACTSSITRPPALFALTNRNAAT